MMKHALIAAVLTAMCCNALHAENVRPGQLAQEIVALSSVVGDLQVIAQQQLDSAFLRYAQGKARELACAGKKPFEILPFVEIEIARRAMSLEYSMPSYIDLNQSLAYAQGSALVELEAQECQAEKRHFIPPTSWDDAARNAEELIDRIANLLDVRGQLTIDLLDAAKPQK